MTPWFSYKASLPTRPLPPLSARPHIETARLIVRPILPPDAQAFHELRRIAEAQAHSTRRGRHDRDLADTQRSLALLQTPHDAHHWYFGAFLAATGELVGEGGMPDTEDQPTSGWTRCELVLKPAYWRQGLGTELLHAVLASWWALPRERRRHQLLPLVAGHHEPGDDVVECVEFVWEADNVAAQRFFATALGQAPVSAEGSFVTIDWREGREGQLQRFAATLVSNPHAT